MKKNILSIENIIIAILAILFVLLIGAQTYISSYYKVGQGFEWAGRAKTTKNLPIMFANFSFYNSAYQKYECDRNVMLRGDSLDSWVNCSGSGYLKNALYPDSLKVIYYSFSESKFYEGAFKLNYQSIQKLAAKMRDTVQKKDGILTQSIDFYLTVYPKGKMVVSMGSYIDTPVGEVEIAQFQAKPAVYDWAIFGNDAYTDNQNEEKGISNNKSVAVQRALFLNKYNWQVEVQLPKEHELENLKVDVFGNVNLAMDTLKNAKIPTFGNFDYLPRKLSLGWSFRAGFEFSTSFKFDEQEVINAFSAIDTPGGKRPIILQIIAKDDSTALRAVLHGGGKSFTLKNVGTKEIFDYKIYH